MIITHKATSRKDTGTTKSRKVRRETRLIPAVVHQGRLSLLIYLDVDNFAKNIQISTSDKYHLEIEGVVYLTRLVEVQRHPITLDIIHADFTCIAG